MSNPATQVATASVIASSVQAGSLHRPATARYPPTGAIASPSPSQRWGHQVNRLERLYPSTQASARGLSARQSGLSSAAEVTKTAAASSTEIHAWVRVSA